MEGSGKKSKKKKKSSNKPKPSPEKEKLVKDFNESVDKFVALVDAPEWVFEKEKKGVKIYRLKSEDSSVHKVKGVGIVQCSMEEMKVFIEPFPESMKVADDMFEHGEILGSVEDMRVLYATFLMPGHPVISNRDFVWLNTDRAFEKYGISFGISSDTTSIGVEKPSQPGYVRGSLLESGYYWRPVEGKDDQVELIYMVQADLAGWLPTWVVNLAAGDQAFNVCRIIQHFNKQKGLVSEEKKDDGEDEEVKPTAEEVKSTAEEVKKQEAVEVPKEQTAKKKKKKKKKKADKETEEPPS